MMAFPNFTRAIKFTFQNVIRNIWLTLMTVTILVLALFSVSMVAGLNSLSDELLTSVKEKVDISVELLPEATEDEGRALVTQILSLDEVKNARFVSREEALEQFKLEHRDDEDIQETLALLEENPLQGRIVIQAKDIESFTSIITYLESPQNSKIVQTENTNLEQAEIVIERLTDLSRQISQIGLGVTIVFIVISFLVVFNTIRIAIYTHREEIGIMKLVGASNWFVRLPFLFEGIVYAFIATIITFAILAPVLTLLAPQLNNAFFADYGVDIKTFFDEHIWRLVVYQFIAAAILNMASGSFAMSRYLKV